MTTLPPAILCADQMAHLLDQDPNFRVLRRFDGDALFTPFVAPADAGIAVVLDTETTGRDMSDKIIELGMVSFAYNRHTGEVYGALERFNALEDPGFPIPPEATAVNHITDDMVVGQAIDDARVQSMVEGADFIVAHNSGFDRPYCETRFPFFKGKAWACSLAQVDWHASGVSSAKLEFIAYMGGFFFSAHRAEMDCLALLNAIRLPLTVGSNGLAQILLQYRKVSRRIWAVNSPYETKDLLKSRGYRWSDGMRDNTEKAWFKEVSDEEFEAELEFLKKAVYRSKPLALPVDTIDSFSRFSTRRGSQERVYR